ncbi:hypothetical protein Rs2_49817 [Raphanus sativus]|nr:hypothetical protein Rs2_49817 [Raphanus sativus]
MKLEESLLKLKTFEDTIKELEKENGSLAERPAISSDVLCFGAEKDKQQKSFMLQRHPLKNEFSCRENNQVNEIYQSTKSELVKLQEQLEVEKSKVDTMVEKVAELTSKLHGHETKASAETWRTRKQLSCIKSFKHLTQSFLKRRQKEAVSQKHSELEATLKKSQEELEAKTSMIVHLESLVKDLEKKVQLADAKSKETETKAKKSRRNVTTTQKAGTSHLMTLKIVLGVAILSVIIGILLGKLLKFFNGVIVFLNVLFYLFAKQGKMLCVM